MKISLVVSTRDNLKYLKWSYDSIRKNQGEHEVHICYGIDHCTDGTQDWISEIKKVDPFVRSIENTTGKRLGHTIMYDRVINEIVDTDIAMIFHSDMYLCPGALDAIEGLMYSNLIMGHDAIDDQIVENKKRIVSLTRIEPPLHPPGPEKIVKDFGTEPETFDEVQLLQFSNRFCNEIRIHGHKVDKNLDENFCTKGVFAPWAFWVDEFKAIGGHDPLYAPQSKEDSDIFNRFKLNGCEFIQTWNGFVYHLTCRGSRFNPNITLVGKNSPEWEDQNLKSTKNFIRKWGSFVQHDEYLHPIIPHKYNVALILTNASHDFLPALEPWFDHIASDLPQDQLSKYIEQEQPNTLFNLTEKFSGLNDGIVEKNDIIVRVDGPRFTEQDWECIQSLSDILTDSGEVGSFQLGNLQITINALTHYEKNLIVCKNEPIDLNEPFYGTDPTKFVDDIFVSTD